MLCSCPSFAAQPTQNVPTTNTTCVRTRSKRPSSFLKTALRSSTSRSIAATVGEEVVFSVFIDGLSQPLDHIRSHFGSEFMRRIIRLELNRAGSRFQLAFVVLDAIGRIELVARSGKVQH